MSFTDFQLNTKFVLILLNTKPLLESFVELLGYTKYLIFY